MADADNGAPAGVMGSGHGSALEYYRGCRCSPCRGGWTDYLRNLLPRSAARCGTRSRYNLGCRCPDCLEANRAYVRGRGGYGSRLGRGEKDGDWRRRGQCCGAPPAGAAFPTAKFALRHYQDENVPLCDGAAACRNLYEKKRRGGRSLAGAVF